MRDLASEADFAIVEGAGGVLVPLDREHTIADFATLLGLQTVLVARDALGVLSYTLTAVEALRNRGISPSAIVLNQLDANLAADLSRGSNADVLADYFASIPIVVAPPVRDPEALLKPASRLLNILKI